MCCGIRKEVETSCSSSCIGGRANAHPWPTTAPAHHPLITLQVLVGNKSDMDESKRAVAYSRGQALADEFKMQFFETSAKSNTNVEEVFQVGACRCGWVGGG